MIIAVATWGVEIGQRGQKDWEKAIIKLQYQALRKATCVVLGSRVLKVDKIAGVELVHTFIVLTQARFIAKLIRDSTKVRDLLVLSIRPANGGREVIEVGVTRRVEEATTEPNWILREEKTLGTIATEIVITTVLEGSVNLYL